MNDGAVANTHITSVADGKGGDDNVEGDSIRANGLDEGERQPKDWGETRRWRRTEERMGGGGGDVTGIFRETRTQIQPDSYPSVTIADTNSACGPTTPDSTTVYL